MKKKSFYWQCSMWNWLHTKKIELRKHYDSAIREWYQKSIIVIAFFCLGSNQCQQSDLTFCCAFVPAFVLSCNDWTNQPIVISSHFLSSWKFKPINMPTRRSLLSGACWPNRLIISHSMPFLIIFLYHVNLYCFVEQFSS